VPGVGEVEKKSNNFKALEFSIFFCPVVSTPLVVELPKKIKKIRVQASEKKNSLFMKL
jgi:hypothetical protein